MRRDIAFDAEGTTLRGWLYTPDAGAGPFPTVVMAHGFSAVKEQYLDRFADAFAGAGLAALVWDNRNFGASDGSPRQEIDPVAQVRDYRHAITFAETLPEVDAARIGAWGTSYSGGHVLMLGAIDRRVKCVVSQVPHISGPVSASRRTRADQLAAALARFDADRRARARGEAPTLFPAVNEDPAGPAAMPGPKPWAFFEESRRTRAPAWRNEITLRSAEMSREYEPGTWVARISPTPLLMIVALYETLTPADLQLDAYERALHPKRLVTLACDHFEPYIEHFDAASGAAVAWFAEHLRPAGLS